MAVVDAHPDRLQVVGLAAGANASLLASQIDHVRPRIVGMATAHALAQYSRASQGAGPSAGWPAPSPS